MNKIESILHLAARFAEAGDEERSFKLAAIAQRSDGALVVSPNGAVRISQTPVIKLREPSAHAEARVLRKAGYGAILFVARIHKDGRWALARPCATCQARIKNQKVSKVYYTIGPGEYGVWTPNKQRRPR